MSMARLFGLVVPKVSVEAAVIVVATGAVVRLVGASIKPVISLTELVTGFEFFVNSKFIASTVAAIFGIGTGAMLAFAVITLTAESSGGAMG